MIGVYIILLLLLVILIHLIYKRNFNRQKQLFLEKKQSEFALSQLKTEKVIMNLKNEKLQNQIESKTRELGTSTMNIIKKNEFLNTLKNELTDLKNVNDVKSIIKMINQDMAKNSDWEMFEEAFNNADSDFLKKIKALHPSLTPNDLRLCAYLRLNLSSKEIAPLLNISPRSVEIKRYRLRKKLELNHKKSLVEYILEI
jgi:DNA-binding CsgD family transcriptional regulator